MKLILIFLLTFSTTVLSDPTTVTFQLSDADKTEIVNKLKQVQSQTQLPSISDLERFSNIGAGVGKGLGAAAKELGLAMNEFSKTPVGLVTTALIIYKVIGADTLDAMSDVVQGLLILILGLSSTRYYAKRYVGELIIYSSEKKNIFGNPIIERIERSKMSDDATAWFMVITLLIIIVGIVALP